MADPYAASSTSDGYGGQNSVVEVPAGVKELTVGVKKSGAGTAGGAAAGEAAAKTAGAAAPPGGAGTVRVTFLFETGPGTNANVYLAGTFNNWDATKDAMVDREGSGVYEITLDLKPGKYQYKFVRDGQWITDTSAKEFADDGFGGKNSVLTVPADAGEKGLIVGMVTHMPEKYGGAKAAGAAAGEQGGRKQPKLVTFQFRPDTPVTNVFLAGTFNDWNDSKTRMIANKDGVYEATLMLPVGRYQYKFVADGRWITDMSAKDFAPDGFGGQNSVITVDDSFTDVKIEKGDGSMVYRDIPLTLDYSMVNPLDRTTIEFRARAHVNDVERVTLVYVVGDGVKKSVEMPPMESDGIYQYYEVSLHESASSVIRFMFVYGDGGKNFYACPAGFHETPCGSADMFVYSDTTIEPFFTPDWAKEGVFYQIFCDRFCNGDQTNDQDFHESYYAGVTKLPPSGKTNGEYFHFVSQWENISGLTQSPYRTDGKPDYYSFYGGDIAGVMEKLPYLHDLGVTIIYFNPLQEARSNHKYDAIDYLKIDPHFADEATFIEFTKKAHENDIRIIVDMALNHTGAWNPMFIDTKEKGPKSKYWTWYEWKRWPLPPGGTDKPIDYYECWWGFGDLPNLNYDLSRPNSQENMIDDITKAEPNMPLVDYLLQIPPYWIGKLGIDGFRLDVPNEVPLWFWKKFRAACDEAKPDNLLVGEIWGNAMPWLGPHYFHSTMNYKYCKDPVLKFIGMGQGSAADFDAEIAPGRNVYPIQATEVMMNLIDSHDTERFVTSAGNSVDRLMLAALFQMTYVGIPHIYYGDEVGLRGGKDPDDRRTFPWGWESNPQRTSIHDFYRTVIAIRREYPALRTGRFTTVLASGRLYAFMRDDDANRIVVVINNDQAARTVELPLGSVGLADGTRLTDRLNGGEYTVAGGAVSISLAPLKGAILVAGPAK
jgi:cyclomaltodextrinase